MEYHQVLRLYLNTDGYPTLFLYNNTEVLYTEVLYNNIGGSRSDYNDRSSGREALRR